MQRPCKAHELVFEYAVKYQVLLPETCQTMWLQESFGQLALIISWFVKLLSASCCQATALFVGGVAWWYSIGFT